jgi:hypothetical protein
MKKILILFLFASLPLLLSGQLSGSGTYANPWNGTLSGNATWSGTVYINGDIIIDNEKLTISAGSIVIFLSETADLRITGTGQLEADGSANNKILFSANDDNDGTYGETGERWGHVSFESMGSAGASILDNCIFEYGDVSSTSLLPANPNQYGGAIHTDFSNLSISFCEIRNCKAGWGGAIFVGNGESPSIANCYIHNNTSTTGGGGIYFWTDSYSTVTNCIITYNFSSGAGGGGLFIGGMAKNVTILNSIISNNSAISQIYGHNIRFNNNTNTPKPKIINSIIWAPANSIVYLSGGSASASDFEYCAIQTPPITYTNCITLNPTNTNVAGPNFVATDGTNWSILPASPCMDFGLDNSSNPQVPLTDFIGKPRVGQTDIGAYEVQFYKWQGDDISTPTVWNDADNWNANAIPSGNEDVYIPRNLINYPTSSTSQNYTIGSSSSMVLAPGAKATFGSLTNSGILKLESDAANISSLIASGFSGNAAQVELYLTGGYVRGDPYFEGKWHYISSPFAAPLAIAPFTAETYDLARWVDGINSEGSPLPGWVAYDGFTYDLDDPSSPPPYSGTGFNTLLSGKGYNFWDNKLTNTYNLSGQLNTSDVVVNLDFAGDPVNQGFNLLGNPFPSGLDWEYVINNTTYPELTGNGIYFTRNNIQYSYVSGVTVPEFGEPATSGIIPPMQGFFVKTSGAGNSITLPAAAQAHNAPNRYKGKGVIPLVRLSISEDSASMDETVVRFDDKALPTQDNNFDAVKMFLGPTKTSIFSLLGTTKYSINGQPFPETSVEIPIVLNLQYTGDHIIKAPGIEALDNYTVTLKDNNTGFTADLRTSPELSFFADATGTITGRFILKISTVTTGTENPVISNNIFNIYPGNSNINIQTISDDWEGKSGSVRIMDLSGRTFSNLQNAEFRKGSLIQVQSPAAKGMYVVEIKAGVKRYVGKVIIK